MWVRIEAITDWERDTGEVGTEDFKGFDVAPCVRTPIRPDRRDCHFLGFAEKCPESGLAVGEMKWWRLSDMHKTVATKSAAMYQLAEQLGWNAGDIGTWDQHRDYAAEFIEGLAKRHPLRLVWLENTEGPALLDVAAVERAAGNKAAAEKVAKNKETE